MKKLDYNIYKYSSFTSVYVPENIKVHNSTDLTSRWSSESNIPPQYLVLKLVNSSIVKSITFGKYEQTHVCNIKKFKIFGGLEAEQNMIELLDGGLKNDSTNETFELRHTVGNGMIPVRYIKIVPLVAWGLSVNFTIWFVELQGIDDPNIIDWNIKYFTMYKEQEIIKLCLKHFRQRNYTNALTALQQDTNVVLEDPLLTEFHNILVENGDYDGAEAFLERVMLMGLFSEYINNKEYRPVWEQIDNGNISEDTQSRPGMRGGHQMCIDPYANTIYLFGGWDGNKDLNDLWSYDVASNKWTLLCSDASVDGGPSPRSCHKMCLDTKRKQIFMLGRYLDVHYRSSDTLQSDFYMYDIETGIWNLLAEDTKAVGGPYLIFDHQMCMDCEERIIYVFGGRVLSVQLHELSANDVVFSGLYAYHVSTSTWRQLLVDTSYPIVSATPTLLSRVGHSMLFHPGNRKLYIFAGQRNKDYLTDFLTYHVDHHTIEQIYKISDHDSGNYPAPGFTQRATIDPETDEIFVLSGLSKEKDKREDNVQNSVWVFRIKENKWKCVYSNENWSETYSKKMQTVEPCPRFAHQLVYDHVTKTHYLFGGNPGRQISPKLRLDDFWKLRLCKPTQTQLLQKCKFLIRQHHFEELARNDTVAALMYLRTKLFEIINHNDPRQIEQFHLLASLLFHNKKEENIYINIRELESTVKIAEDKYPVPVTETNTPTNETNIKDNHHHFRRAKLYEKLIIYFPQNMSQPKDNLVDLIDL